MDIIKRVDNENGFSWWTIETDGNDFYLFVSNKNGLHRQNFMSKRLENIENALTRRIAFSKKMNIVMANLMKDIKNNPELLQKLKK